MTQLLGLLGLIAAVWVIYDVWTNQKDKSSEAKLIWTISAVLFNIITAIVYYLTEKKNR